MTRFLVDAQLPRRLAIALRQNGFDAVHTLDLPNGNIDNNELLHLFAANIAQLATMFETYTYVELSRDQLIAHQ